ncbi:MAG: CPBP family intramembrane metalloprotease [Lachnospiraceae bacterium]|nr:CPBP family intramembrane metalloprotease [Lachnospiraceae bacterium]
MEKMKKIGKGCLPFLAAIAFMYLFSIIFLMASGYIWGFFHYEQVLKDSSIIANLYLDEAWISSVSIGISIAIYLAFIIIFGLWYKKAFGRDTQKYASKKAFSGPVIINCIVFGISVQCFFSCALNLILPLFPKTHENYKELLNSMGMGQGLMPFVYTALLAPVAEELIFRGLTLKYQEKVLPYFTANFMQAFLFGIYHQNIVQFVYAFFVGILLGYLCKKYNSLVLVMVVHGIVNASGNLFSYFHIFSRIDKLEENVVTVFVSMICMVASFWFLMRSEQKKS